MTVSALLDSSSDTTSDLPAAFVINLDELDNAESFPPDNTEQINPGPNVCPTCGEVVERRPGQRGRVGKYHPECKPTGRTKSAGTPISGQPRAVRVSKAELVAAEETEAIIEFLRVKLTQGAMLLALVEPYDALVIRVNTPELLNNLRPVLMQFPRLRAFAGATQVGGSLFGLILTLATTLLPIAAHHNFVPVKKVSQFLVQLPLVMLSIQKRMAEGNEEDLTETLFQKAMAKAQQTRQARMRMQAGTDEDGSTVDASEA